MNKIRTVLIMGIQHSGTSLLCSLLGAHSKINMRCENYGKSLFKPAGKPINANKLCIHQIGNKKPNCFRSLINRIHRIFTGLNYFSFSKLTLQEINNKNTKVIKIVRDEDKNIDSIMNREGFNYSKSKRIYRKDKKKLDGINGYKITLKDLTHNTKKTLLGLCKFLGIKFENQMLNGYEYMKPEYKRSKIEHKM